MIAPLREPQELSGPLGRRMRLARRTVAAVLLDDMAEQSTNAAPIIGWRAWLMAGWMTVAIGAYVWELLQAG